MAKKNVLGRGLGALIADAAEEPVTREIVVSAIQIAPFLFSRERSLTRRL